ncbi:eukaryotic rRNA processing protein EBP2 domain-containing protein [Sarocladium implicatum]|nr:eukaryotic rRNA processing protein EBP2 domain-containing protein [Sarocladium implicatum]
MALAAEKGVDFKKQNQKKRAKEAEKRKQAKGGVAASEDEDDQIQGEYEEIEIEEVGSTEDDEGDEQDDSEEDEVPFNLEAVDESDTSDSSVGFEERLPKKPRTVNGAKVPNADGDDDEDEEEDEEDIPISDLEDLDENDKEDLIPHTRLTINNTSALLSSLSRIALPTAPFAFHQSVVSSAPTADSIPDISDDLQRELAFYSQSLEAVRVGRAKLLAEGVPFSRPKDYFAEMVKEDAHMEKVKSKLVEEATNKKAAAEARKLRDLKKFGKQVQVAKLQERQKEKRETLEKIKNLKRKRQENNSGDIGTNEADLFDVGVDKELSNPSGRSGAGRGAGAGGPNLKRQTKDKKYGFGGKKRHAKSGDAMSSGDLSGFDAKRMKAGGGGGRVAKGRVTKPQRPGKNRRKAHAGH